jgi:peroxiredoxin
MFTLLLVFSVVTAEAGSPRIGARIDGFRLPDTSGAIVDTGRFKGRTVVIFFWNNLCGCSQQLLALKDFVSARKNRPFAFVTVNEGQGRALVDSFIHGNRLPYEALLDGDLAVGKKNFGIKVLPTIFIIDKDGVLWEKLIGVLDNRRLEAIIQRYL